MQIDKTTIKRPRLIDSFFHMEIDYKNDFVEYIYATPDSHNIKKSLKSKNRLLPPPHKSMSSSV